MPESVEDVRGISEKNKILPVARFRRDKFFLNGWGGFAFLGFFLGGRGLDFLAGLVAGLFEDVRGHFCNALQIYFLFEGHSRFSYNNNW